jgi:hypothetical protein
MSQTATPLIVSLMFCLENEQGHIFSYNMSVGKAARMIGWEHIAAVRAAARVDTLPEGWSLCLGTRDNFFNWKPLVRIEKMLKLIASLIRLMHEQATSSRPAIYLLEWFDPVHLIAFCLSLMLAPRHGDCYVWILHRFEFPHAFITTLYKFLHSSIRWRVGHKRLVLFSETDLVAESLVKTFGQDVHVLPMPQIILPSEKPNMPTWNAAPERQSQIVCWWPGHPAAQKGMAIIARLIQLTGEDARHLCIVADQKTGFKATEGGCQLILLPTGMNRADYLGWLYAMDLALLPYDPIAYAKRTSGPFADTISAGKPPVVTNGTWMAHELRKYQLDQLILDWNSPTILSDLRRVAADTSISEKLARMRSDYNHFHSFAGYAETMRGVFEKTKQ